MILNPSAVAEAAAGRLARAAPAGRITTDTRALQPGDWFLALRGDRFDGHGFLERAVAAGAVGVIADAAGAPDPDAWSHGLIVVEDTLAALQAAAVLARDALDCPVVGITGSAGKTTTRAMVGCTLSSMGVVHQTRGNLNNHIGLPLTLLAAPINPVACVVEMGMSAPGEIHLLQAIARPQVRLITNVGAAHLEGAGSLEGVARCKGELFAGARSKDWSLINADDPWIMELPRPAGHALTFGSSARCDVRLLERSIDPDTLHTTARIATPDGELSARLAAPGAHIAQSALAAAAVAFALGVAPDAIGAGLSNYRPVGMRMRVELVEGLGVVINDAYNANPASAEAALRTLAQLSADRGQRAVALLGDMLELGPGAEDLHAEIARLAGDLAIPLVGFAGALFGAVADRAVGAGEVLRADDAVALGAALRGRIGPDDLVLLKGSRGMRMERALDALTQGDR